MNPSCSEFQRLIVEKIQGEALTSSQEERLASHLHACPACRAYKEEMSRLYEEIRETTLPPLQDSFFEDLREDVLESLSRKRGFSFFLKRLAQWSPVASVYWRGVWVPVISGVCGLLLGFAIATAWHRPLPSPSSVSSSPSLLSETRETSRGSSENISTDLLAEMGDFVTVPDILDTLNEEEIHTLISDWSKELPPDLLDTEPSGWG